MGYTENPYEKCKNCIHCAKLYVPPAKCFDYVPDEVKNGYVCTVFLEEAKRVQFLGDNQGLCEMFTAAVKCGTCKYHDNYSGACGNGESKYRGDFTDNRDYCEGGSE